MTFRVNLYSAVMSVIVIGALANKIKQSWRKQPISLETWQDLKKKALAAKVYTDATKNQITWADPAKLNAMPMRLGHMSPKVSLAMPAVLWPPSSR